MARKILSRLRFDAKMVRNVSSLVGEHMWNLPSKPQSQSVARKFRASLGNDPQMIENLLDLRRADWSGKGQMSDFSLLDRFADTVRAVTNDPIMPNDLAINGHDLMAAGVNGPSIRDFQTAVMPMIWADPELNNRDWLLKMAAKRKGNK